MTSQPRLSCLIGLRDEIARLTAPKCRMLHERIVMSTETMLPVVNRFPPDTFKRVGLCNAHVRAQRLGCSHTISRTRLEDAIKELDARVAKDLRVELNWLDNEIHLLDHRRGNAEARHARTMLEARSSRCLGGTSESSGDSEEVTAELERLHDAYVERIGALRDRVLAELEKAIVVGQSSSANRIA